MSDIQVAGDVKTPSMSDPMEPRDVQFLPVSSSLTKVRVISALIALAPLIVITALVAFFTTKLLLVFTLAFAVCLAWVMWLIPRQVRAMGYALARDEFLIRKGIMFRRLTIIPFGRIQYVEVSEGPVARAFGIAEIKLHTASVETSGTLNGVPSMEAARLRDMLSQRGTSELAGL